MHPANRYTRTAIGLHWLIALLITVLVGVETVSTLFSVLATSLAITIWGHRGELLVVLLIIGIQFVSIGLLGEMITRSNASDRRNTVRRSIGF